MDQENNKEKQVRRRKSSEALTARILRSFADASDTSVSKILSIKEICEAEEDFKLTPMQIRYWMAQHQDDNYIVRTERPADSEEGARTHFFKLTEAGLIIAHKS